MKVPFGVALIGFVLAVAAPARSELPMSPVYPTAAKKAALTTSQHKASATQEKAPAAVPVSAPPAAKPEPAAATSPSKPAADETPVASAALPPPLPAAPPATEKPVVPEPPAGDAEHRPAKAKTKKLAKAEARPHRAPHRPALAYRYDIYRVANRGWGGGQFGPSPYSPSGP